jgi:glucose/arabinose dehydrogenase
MSRSRAVAVLIALSTLFPLTADAQIRSQVIASGLSSPLALVPDPQYPNVLYVVQQGGLVRVLVDGQLQPTPFIDLRGVISTGGERGLLGMAFAPDVASGRVFFNFTNTNGDTVVARFRRLGGGLQADPATRFDLFWPTQERVIRQPFANHNGGHLLFGPDGYLYIGMGDGGSGNDPLNNAQNAASLLGKMLRLDINVADADPSGYRVPPDNPFVDFNPVAALGEIWDFGLRNPWRFSFDDFGPGATGALIIGDVGQGSREEIDYEPRGAGGRNYGWRLREGRIATPGVPASPGPAYGPLTDPIFDYPRSEGQAVTGGFVYRGAALGAAYQGRYFFADFSSSRVWSLGLGVDPGSGEAAAINIVEHTAELGGSLSGVASFGRDLQGELYLLTFAGRVLKIVPASSTPPGAPTNLQSVVSGSTVTVSWTPPSTGAAPLGYQLEAGSAPGAANLAVVAATATSLTFPGVPAGTYFVRVRSVGSGGLSGPSNEVVVVVGGGGCSGAPPAPTELAAAVNGRRVTLAWNVAATGNGPTAFVLEAGSASGLANLAVISLDGSLRALAVDAPPGQYFVRIRGQNACGTGPASNEIVVTVF